jgi:hypothetical protein
MRISANFVLCMTATIDPMGMPGVSRPDPRARESDYLQCLQYYCRHDPQIHRILFLENSGWPLERLQREARFNNPYGKTLEFVSLRCNEFPRELGKGYGEFLMLDEGLRSSCLVRDADYIAKITGRYRLLNLTRLIERMQSARGLLCDVRDHDIYRRLGIRATARYCDTRFFAFLPAFYERQIRGAYIRCNDARGYYAENLLFEVATRSDLQTEVCKRFPIEPDYRGFAGYGSKDFGSKSERGKRLVRAIARRVVPWLYV